MCTGSHVTPPSVTPSIDPKQEHRCSRPTAQLRPWRVGAAPAHSTPLAAARELLRLPPLAGPRVSDRDGVDHHVGHLEASPRPLAPPRRCVRLTRNSCDRAGERSDGSGGTQTDREATHHAASHPRLDGVPSIERSSGCVWPAGSRQPPRLRKIRGKPSAAPRRTSVVAESTPAAASMAVRCHVRQAGQVEQVGQVSQVEQVGQAGKPRGK